jgi:hypothetical protein
VSDEPARAGCQIPLPFGCQAAFAAVKFRCRRVWHKAPKRLINKRFRALGGPFSGPQKMFSAVDSGIECIAAMPAGAAWPRAQRRASKNATILCRCAASGSRPRPAQRLSAMCSGLLVPGITAVTASLPRRYLRKNWPQLAASKSAAHSSGFCPRSARKSRLRANGRSVNCGRGRDHPLLRRAVGERIIDLKKIRLLAPHHRLDGIEVAARGGGDPEIPAETLRLPFCAVSPNPGADRRHCGAASNRHGWCGAAAMRLAAEPWPVLRS